MGVFIRGLLGGHPGISRPHVRQEIPLGHRLQETGHHQVSTPPSRPETPHRPHNLCPCAGGAGEWKGGDTVLFPGLPLGSQPSWGGPPRPCWGFGKGEGKLSPRLLGWGWGRWSRRKRSGLLGPVGKSGGTTGAGRGQPEPPRGEEDGGYLRAAPPSPLDAEVGAGFAEDWS